MYRFIIYKKVDDSTTEFYNSYSKEFNSSKSFSTREAALTAGKNYIKDKGPEYSVGTSLISSNNKIYR